MKNAKRAKKASIKGFKKDPAVLQEFIRITNEQRSQQKNGDYVYEGAICTNCGIEKERFDKTFPEAVSTVRISKWWCAQCSANEIITV